MASNSRAKPKSATKAKPSSTSSSKQEILLRLLKRPNGALLNELTTATQWQAHSIRGFLSATVKKKLGLTVVSERTDAGERRYRVVTHKGAKEAS